MKISHFSEIVLVIVLLLLLVFVCGMQYVHNDSLASKGMEFSGQALAALLTLMVASKPSTTQATEVKFTDPTDPKEK